MSHGHDRVNTANVPSYPRVPARPNDMNSAESGIPSNTPATSPADPFIAAPESHHPPSLMRTPSYPPNSICFECLAITAGVIIAIQFNMLTSDSMATTTATRALLLFGITFELLAILLTATFIQSHQNSQALRRLPALPVLRLTSSVPIMLFLMGIVSLAAALVVEMLKISLCTAVAMTGFLIVGIILCLLTSFFGQ